MTQTESKVEPTLTTGIRIDVESEVDDCLDSWAETEARSKREHVKYIVKEIVRAWKCDPFILQKIQLLNAGHNTFGPGQRVA